MRATAIRIPLKELDGAEFVRVEEQYVPSYAITSSGLNVSRVSVFGIVVRRYETENFISIKLDDFTGTIDAIAFGEHMDKVREIKEGNAVKVIGRVREGNNGLFISVEGVQKLDFEEEMFKRLEILDCYYRSLGNKGKEDKSKPVKKKEKKETAEKEKPMLADFVQADELEVEKEVIE
ncbi:MAG: hypothetical protein J7L44_04405 [Candidatus Diapherotrites archaeon]|nr:hypothetical protein [Candidatus Diapherotrites archaeon]